ncbi:hypothetical protein D9611_012881 [Ephemerocybe angulata]|uniref:Uncharacterized protein n=1 Tax=Ephemerocybe angulata TaxID=980116 RepID=A0A8H5F1H1_9AGAR|nr:hypothetical protein D9611_012881 [Tulosesus angulatus]
MDSHCVRVVTKPIPSHTRELDAPQAKRQISYKHREHRADMDKHPCPVGEIHLQSQNLRRRATSQPSSTRRRQTQTSTKLQPSPSPPQACATPEDAISDLHDVRRSFSAVGACAERRRTTSHTDASVLLQRPNAPPTNVNTKGCWL